MTVYVLMPVFNRLSLTKSMLECLRTQHVDEAVSIVIVDDGSTDGTGEYLAAQPDVTVLHGDGSLWWGGAIDLAVKHVLTKCSPDDWVMFVNNDTLIREDFIQSMLALARNHAPAAVGSVIRDIEEPHRLLSIGPRINAWRMRIGDVLDLFPGAKQADNHFWQVDALSGRGVLYPATALSQAGGMRPKMLPHYLADYEIALRVRSAGWKLLVSSETVVYSHEEYGNAFRASSIRERFFSVRSPSYLPARMSFWWSASTPLQRLTLPVRAALRALLAFIRNRT